MTRVRLACALVALGFAANLVAEPLPYLGEWSNGRGETLTISESILRFAENEPVKYRDITKATAGSSFELQITTPGEINAFPGKFVSVFLEDDALKMKTFSSHADHMQEKDPQSIVTWFKDSDN